jgi:hypothetical protein
MMQKPNSVIQDFYCKLLTYFVRNLFNTMRVSVLDRPVTFTVNQKVVNGRVQRSTFNLRHSPKKGHHVLRSPDNGLKSSSCM